MQNTWLVRAAGATFTLADPRLFLRKTVTVFALAVLLLPLVRMKSQVPALAYVTVLLALHVAVLGLYFYRTQVRSLDPDRRSLIARVIAVAFLGYLLYVVSRVSADTPTLWLVAQVLVASALHTSLLALLSVKVELQTRIAAPAVATVEATSEYRSTPPSVQP
jgi:hypothetical protein